MAKYFFRLILLIGVLLGILAIIGSLLPRSYDFESQVQIEASPKRVFDEVNTIANWRDWTQWNPERIPDLEVKYSGSETGVGATQSWTDVRGSGKLWITESQPDQLIVYEMVFANFPRMTSRIEIQPIGEQTHVRWSSQGKLPGGPFYGFFAPFFSTQMGYEYERNLDELKQKLESGSGSEQWATDPPGDRDN